MSRISSRFFIITIIMFAVAVAAIVVSTFAPTSTATSAAIAAATPSCSVTTTLTGAQEVPPTGSAGTGSVVSGINGDHTSISVVFNWSGLSSPVTSAWVQGPAAPGSNGPNVWPFWSISNTTSGSVGVVFTAFDPSRASDYLDGLFYLNIQTTNFPDGEVRAQLVPVCISVTPTASNTATESPTSTATPDVPYIEGVVKYPNAANPPKFVAGATVCANGSPTVCTTTDSAGYYILTGMGTGPYTLSATKTDQLNHISANDCARIAQHVSGLLLLTDNVRKIAADVSGNGGISSIDAAKVCQSVASQPIIPPNQTKIWRFFAPNPTFPIGSSPTSYTYPSVTGPITGQDLWGILEGEVTGNWDPAGARPAGGTERSMSVELPSLVTKPAEGIVIPVQVKGAVNKDIISYEFDLRYDPSVIQPDANAADVKRTASRGLNVVTNVIEPGLLRVVVYGAMPIDRDGVLLNLKFTSVGKPGSTSLLSFEQIIFNEGETRVSVADGQVELF